MLLVSDLAAGDSGALSGPLADGLLELTAGSFDEVMAAAAPVLRWIATHPLQAGKLAIELELRFKSMRSFEPSELAQQIPATRRMLAIREQLAGRLRGKVTGDELAGAVARAASEDRDMEWLVQAIQWTPAAPAAAPQAVDSLLESLDLGQPGAADAATPTTGSGTPRTPLGSLVSALAGGGSVPSEEASAVRRAIGELDRRVSAWLTAVLHAAPVQALEAAWRSLGMLVSRIDFRKGTRLFVLHAKKSELLERFRSLVIDSVFDAGAESPELIVVDASYANTAPDIDALDELAQHAASLPAVVLAGVSASFFGVKNAWQVPGLPSLVGLADQYQFAKWRSLRDQPYARSLGVVFGRGLLRAGYAREETPELEFRYREECLGEQDFVWASGAVAAACAAAGSLADTGWPVGMAGYVHGRVGGFAMAQGGKKGEKRFGPTDVTLAENKISEMAMLGVNVLAPAPRGEDAVLWNGLTAARPGKADQVALLEISLPYQLFAARLGTLLFELKPQLRGMKADDIISCVRRNLCEWLGIAGEPPEKELNVQVRQAADDPLALELAVTAAPPEHLLPGGVPVVMGYRIT